MTKICSTSLSKVWLGLSLSLSLKVPDTVKQKKILPHVIKWHDTAGMEKVIIEVESWQSLSRTNVWMESYQFHLLGKILFWFH